MAFIDELSTYTRTHIAPGVVDQVFKNDPTLAYMRANCIERFPGGKNIQENIVYAMLDGGPYALGDSFAIKTRQTDTGLTFDPKQYQVSVTLMKEIIQVYNKGPEAVFRIVDSKLQNAALTMSAILAVDLYNAGQGAGRTLRVNGFAEALNDGATNSWTGAAYTTYGTLTRGGEVGTALNSPMTTPAANVGGPITYKLLEEGYNTICIGPEHPDLLVTTNLGLSYIKEKFHPQWRTETQDPKIGFNSIVFNAARCIQSQYCPGTQGLAADGPLSSYLAAGGETLWMFNTKYIRFWVTDDPEFGFGFSGFKPAQDNTIVAGQYFYIGNITNQAPRLMRHFYNITG
jgi:hypothetical protein